MKEDGWVPLWLTGKKCAATESRLTALSQWTARYKSVISPKSLFFWLTDKFTKVTVFTAQGGSSSVQNLDPLREMGKDVAVKLLVEKWTHKHEKWDWAWCHLKNQHRHNDWQSPLNGFATKLLLYKLYFLLWTVLFCSPDRLILFLMISMCAEYSRR